MSHPFAKIITLTKNHPITLFLLFGFFFALFLSSLIPPFQSPDEQDHLKRAYLLSKGKVVMDNKPGHSTGGEVDAGLSDYMGRFNHLRFDTERKLTQDVAQQAAGVQWSGTEVFSEAPGVNNYFPLIYTPQALGLWTGRILGLTIEQSYYLSRSFNVIFVLVVLGTAFSFVRPNLFAVGVLITPLMLFQMVSTSQDSLAIALVVLATSIFIRITKENSDASPKLFWWLCICIVLVSTARVNMVPMLLMPFAATFVAKRKVSEYWLPLLTVAVVLSWIFYALNTTVDRRVSLEASTTGIISFYLQNPFQFLVVLKNTLADVGLRNFYAGSFVGILGWLDTHLDKSHIQLVWIGLLVLLIASFSWKAIKAEWRERFVLLIVAGIAVLLTFFLLLISWTTHPARIIDGVQGRYLWGPAIILGYALCVSVNQLSVIRRGIILVALLIVVTISVAILPKVLMNRYHANHFISIDLSIV